MDMFPLMIVTTSIISTTSIMTMAIIILVMIDGMHKAVTRQHDADRCSSLVQLATSVDVELMNRFDYVPYYPNLLRHSSPNRPTAKKGSPCFVTPNVTSILQRSRSMLFAPCRKLVRDLYYYLFGQSNRRKRDRKKENLRIAEGSYRQFGEK